MRYFAELAYNGHRFFGWQKQPHNISVQETIENALSTILRQEIEVTGCGRTDTGVHARQYFLHFDFEGEFPSNFQHRLNKYLPPDIAIFRIFESSPEAHARYDAVMRSYEYHLSWRKDPFSTEMVYFYNRAADLDEEKLNAAANLLMQYDNFYPFCKSNTDVKTMRCQLHRSEWVRVDEEAKLIYYISANRFLRGMVRLIVGMCLNVAQGKVSLEEVRQALEDQSRLKRSESAPPEGLFLTEIKY